jgi:hypothetical protein
MDRVAVANHIEGPVTLTLPRPNAALFPIVNVPPLCVSTPENVFAPLNVNPPEDSVIPPPKFTDPAAENVPPFTKTLPPTEEAALKLSVPPPTLSPPPIVTAPLNVAVFTPDFTKLNAVDPVSVNAPEIVRAPEVFAPPSVNVTGAKVLATSACSVMPTAESLAKVWLPDSDKPIRSVVSPTVNAPEPVFLMPPDPNAIVCTPVAEPKVTPKFDAMFNPNNAMLEFRTGLCASVSPLAKSAVVVPSGRTPPTHEVPKLKFVPPLTQLTAITGCDVARNTPPIKTEMARMNQGIRRMNSCGRFCRNAAIALRAVSLQRRCSRSSRKMYWSLMDFKTGDWFRVRVFAGPRRRVAVPLTHRFV